eukprot:GEZU01039239.1.p1 GENE.GEZU01039239.1~~GEZU01039239.1.p1  ORF type:complete len:136 (+),score=55.10 GEZU01039239.1:94-501(+)
MSTTAAADTTAATTTATKKVKKSTTFRPRVRLYVSGRILGYKRSLRNQVNQYMLIQIAGVNKKVDTKFYMGKRVAYLYKAAKKTGINTFEGKRVIWGKIVKAHGASGVVRAKFQRNLPGQAIGKPVKVMLYPSNI